MSEALWEIKKQSNLDAATPRRPPFPVSIASAGAPAHSTAVPSEADTWESTRPTTPSQRVNNGRGHVVRGLVAPVSNTLTIISIIN